LADKFYGIALGGMQPKDVTEAGSTTSAVVELRINDTVYGSKLLVQQALEAIVNYIATKETTPIG